MLEQDYLKPDPRWGIWGCNSFQSFSEKFIIKGKFHSKVPEDIKKSYEIAERIMAYSYYCYELYDEAFSKITRIFEMAISLRCEQLDIKFKSKQPKLSEKIEKLKVSYPGKDLVFEWDKFKELRNYFAHPKRHSFGGPINKFGAFEHSINVINRIFKEAEFFKEIDNQLLPLLEHTKRFHKGLFVLEADQNYLVYQTRPYLLANRNNEQIILWKFVPVLIKFPQGPEGLSQFKPIIIWLKSIKITDDEVSGINHETGDKIILRPTISSENLEKYNSFNLEYSSAPAWIQNLYKRQIEQGLNYEIIKFQYDFFWD